jgi:hypothetical protein
MVTMTSAEVKHSYNRSPGTLHQLWKRGVLSGHWEKRRVGESYLPCCKGAPIFREVRAWDPKEIEDYLSLGEASSKDVSPAKARRLGFTRSQFNYLRYGRRPFGVEVVTDKKFAQTTDHRSFPVRTAPLSAVKSVLSRKPRRYAPPAMFKANLDGKERSCVPFSKLRKRGISSVRIAKWQNEPSRFLRRKPRIGVIEVFTRTGSRIIRGLATEDLKILTRPNAHLPIMDEQNEWLPAQSVFQHFGIHRYDLPDLRRKLGKTGCRQEWRITKSGERLVWYYLKSRIEQVLDPNPNTEGELAEARSEGPPLNGKSSQAPDPEPNMAEQKEPAPRKPSRPGRKRGSVDPEVAQRKREMLERWDRREFESKAAAGRAYGFHRSDATKLINEHLQKCRN